MVNKLHQILFSLSSSAPVLFCFAIVWCIKKQNYAMPIIAFSLGLVLTLYTPIFIIISKKKVQTITAKVSQISINNKAVWTYVISYLVPIFGFIREEINIITTVIILIVLGLVLPLCNLVFPNPLLRLLGYNFYNVKSIDGVDGYCLISKRKKISDVSRIKYVQNLFSYYLLEKE